MEIVVLFWTNVLLGIGQAVTLAIGLYRRPRHHRSLAVACVGLTASLVVSGLMWLVDGPCVLPHPRVVEFYEGIALCPGQSAQLPPIKLIVPRSGRDL